MSPESPASTQPEGARPGAPLPRRAIAGGIALLVVAVAAVVWIGRDDSEGRAVPALPPATMVRIVGGGSESFAETSGPDTLDADDIESSGIASVAVLPGTDEELLLLPIGDPWLIVLHPDGRLERRLVDGLEGTTGTQNLVVDSNRTAWVAMPDEEVLLRIPLTDAEVLTAEEVSLPAAVVPTAVAVHPDGGVVVGDGARGHARVDSGGTVVERVPAPGGLQDCPYEQPGLRQVVVDDLVRPGPSDLHVAADGTVFAADRASCPGLWRSSPGTPTEAEPVLDQERCPATDGSPEPDGIVSLDDGTLVVADHFCPGFWVVRPGAEPELVEIADNPDDPDHPWDGPQDLAVGPSGTLYFPSPNGVYALRLP